MNWTFAGVALSAAMVMLPLAGGMAEAQDKPPNILVIWGDDIGTWNISHNSAA